LGRRVTPKRILLAVCLAVATSLVLVPGAAAHNFDPEKMGCAGEELMTCPPGTEGQPYSLAIYLKPPDSGRGEDFGCATFHVVSGGLPPGISVSDEGYFTGTPTASGSYRFWLEVKYDKEEWCGKVPSQGEFVIPINPGVPRLTIGPESAPVGTVRSPYSLQMTANLSDPKTWSIVEGALPPGLQIDGSTGMISGTPQTAGTYGFTVRAAITEQRTDTKALAITVRDPVSIVAPRLPSQTGTRIRWEVGVAFTAAYSATGGTGTFTWSLAAGELPPGLVLGADGSLSGRPTTQGTFPFALAATDSEGRRAVSAARFVVAPKLRLAIGPLRVALVGRSYRSKLVVTGGVAPRTWRVVFGPLPRGLRLDRQLGVVWGTPRRSGRYWVRFEVVDALGIKVAKNYLIRVGTPKAAGP
jgi:large repetitive protein